ncbi:sulfatase family protein [Limnoglobus roseus]|uniref:Sulfatase n=1 Tax=Limnoglobus roseus TaxID=2598579 RepID=A0A5C1AW24_9BACT|nr:sulfatase-like hydrolase/transferase [Limnoglobus roseus]QEL20998.1 sulfatase [Limnoglobus roseus]
MKVIVFVLRGCSAGWLGAYGNEWVVTPDLDRFAAEGVVFDRHISDCPEAAAARRAWQTGRDQFRTADGPSPDLLQSLRDAGVFTALVRANREANDALPDYYAGWGKLFDARPVPGEGTLSLEEEMPGVLEHLAAHVDWLLWVEIDALLPPWDVSPAVFKAYVEDLVGDAGKTDDDPLVPWADPETGWFDREDVAAWELLHRSFAAVVTQLDADLGRVFEQLRAAGAVQIVTSDAGFPLGEHGVIGPHRPLLHEELVHLPLMIRWPDAAHSGLRLNAFTQPADLMPTILGLFGRPILGGVEGHELAGLWQGTVEGIRPHAVSVLSLGGASEAAIRTDEWAYLRPEAQHADDADEPRTAALFVKPDDRWEVNDIAAREADVMERLEQELKPSGVGDGQPGR